MLNAARPFNLSDFMQRNSEVLIQHLASIFACLVKDTQLTSALAGNQYSWALSTSDVRRLAKETEPMIKQF